MSALRVAVIGCGFMGRMHANVYHLLPNAELVGVVDGSQERADELGGKYGAVPYTDIEQVVNEGAPDVIDICLPTFLHKEFTLKAAEYKKHIVCEKPMALSLADADEMISATANAGVYLMIAHCIRFWPEYARLKEIVVSGELGKLISLNLTRLGQFPTWSAENWLGEEDKSGGGVLDMHIHDSDFALYLLGWPKDIVSYGNVDGHGTSYAFTTLAYPDCVVHLEGGWNLPKGTPFRMTFRAVFEDGAVFWDGGPMTVYREQHKPEVQTFPIQRTDSGGNIDDLGGYYAELKYFIDKVQAGEDLEIATPLTSRESLALCLEEIRQIKSRR